MPTSSKEDFCAFCGQKWTDLLVSLGVGDDLRLDFGFGEAGLLKHSLSGLSFESWQVYKDPHPSRGAPGSRLGVIRQQ